MIVEGYTQDLKHRYHSFKVYLLSTVKMKLFINAFDKSVAGRYDWIVWF